MSRNDQRHVRRAVTRRGARGLQRRTTRSKVVIGIMAGLMVLSLFVAPLLSLLSS